MRDRPRGYSNSRKSPVTSGNVRTAERERRIQVMRVPRRKGARKR